MTEENAEKLENVESRDVTGERIAELEALLATRNEELAKANARLAEVEHAVAVSQESLSAVTDGLNKAVSSYRSLVVKSNPDVLEELIKGDSVEAIGLSLKSARELIGRVKTSIEAEISAVRVPAGAPPRSSMAVPLSPREKIQQGMERVKS